MPIDYDHAANRHTLDGPRAALPVLFATGFPESLLDVGCGNGTWLKAALELGITDVLGIDGLTLREDALHIPARLFQQRDLTTSWSLGRQFDAALCLEVAEHLAPEHGRLLVEALTQHAPRVVFSAACPGQDGQHHVNCQWPVYWQALFNERGFRCDDPFRPLLWDDAGIEPWYRQNVFLAQKDAASAGTEPRLRAFVHPAIFTSALANLRAASAKAASDTALRAVQDGEMSPAWYLSAGLRAAGRKLSRRVQSGLQERPGE